MAHIAAIGERLRIVALESAGVLLRPAEEPEAVPAAWQGLPPDVELVIVTPAAAEALGEGPVDGQSPLIAVMPP
ncbi:hypothetical protein OG895_35210 [Streptomyces sp. NBC_00201]|uniref:hypothetical protein n=1 Tax=unclassified Streptomyces TaxID=2593676 RepID=UPI00224F5B5F|nr:MULTISPECIES: hypothetical protein [unclassified Streptomyces]MCX5062719.1 hypothetical protein [Streptomyces sp. NBC_00452]MCX5250399.1 hypothetical protein [Streptomyces sp. NBC_00201]MCX5291674.1 hypothetical protein [Streptomyces sp. NBC_00183]